MTRRREQNRRSALDLLPKHSTGAEIGVWKGDLSIQILRVVEPRRLHLIDPWRIVRSSTHSRALYGARHNESQRDLNAIYKAVRRRFWWSAIRRRVRIHRLTSLDAIRFFDDRTLDWVWIDGDHTYRSISADLDAWRGKLKHDSLIVADAYGVSGWWDDSVTRAVDERVDDGKLSVVATYGSLAVLRGQDERVYPQATNTGITDQGPYSDTLKRPEPRSANNLPSILIVGIPKTGTSALYASIKQAGDFLSIYEIGNRDQLRYLAQNKHRPQLAKILVPRLPELAQGLSMFNRILLIVRDPRDVVISWLLYRPFLHGNYENGKFIKEFVGLLRSKEADPRRVSIGDLHSVYERHSMPITRLSDYGSWFREEQRFAREHPEAPIVRYEDYLAGDISGLSEYLGVYVSSTARLGSYNSYNSRAKAAGGWRDWFTESDIERYRPLFSPYLELRGYSDDWELAANPQIDSRVSSEHICANVERLTEQPPSTGYLLEPPRYTSARMDMLRSAVEDGRETSMIELALAYRDGLGVSRNAASAAELLTDVAARGNPLALVHLALAYRYGVGRPVDPDSATAFLAEAVTMRGNRRVKSMLNRLTPGWKFAAVA